jgi:hypothetical protein
MSDMDVFTGMFYVRTFYVPALYKQELKKYIIVKGKHMWNVKYKPNNDSQPWTTLESYASKAMALIHASRASGEYFMVKVIDREGRIIWRA